MTRMTEYVYKFYHTPKKIFFKQVVYKIKVCIGDQFYRIHDYLLDTRRNYREAELPSTPLPISLELLDVTKIDSKKAAEAWRMYRNHRFDLLGSGWVKNGFLDNAAGFEQYRYPAPELKTDEQGEFLQELLHKRNLKKSKEIWKRISFPYEGIDWQKDYKSGYRWEADQWYRPQGYAKKRGGDIKVPWELARLQHFPRLAILARIFPDKKQDIFREYCNQLLDFIAQNPPRMGVNYMCTMDVGIRTANIALSYSLFKMGGMEFEKNVEQILINFMFEQCNHIFKNLEWSDILTSNHYFADIAGLLYGSAILPECKRKDKWFHFAVDQIKREIIKQFYEEGTNAEGSTAYHRLTGEMAVYSAALIHGLSKQGVCSDLSQQAYDILYGAGKFIHDITRPDGSFTQIGDNDSGEFFKLSFTGELMTAQSAINKYDNLCRYVPENGCEPYLDENMNDGRTFVAAVCGLVEADDLQIEKEIYSLEYSMVRLLMQNDHIAAAYSERNINISGAYQATNLNIKKTSYIAAKSSKLTERLQRIAYPEFGIYLFKSPTLYLCINAADNGQKGNAGHAHNDKLSFELFIEGECIFQDSGTYVYTALPEERNRFRSVKMHNTIYAGKEQNEYIGLFSMKSRTVCTCVQWEDNQAVLQVTYDDVIHVRKFSVQSDRIVIEDQCNQNFEVNLDNREVTAGYGKKISHKKNK